jgi:uncharacterized protein YciI
VFIVLLKFSTERERAKAFMADHQAWLGRGFDDGVFLLSGSLGAQLGGAIVAHSTSLAALQGRVNEDPFVRHGVVSAEILEVAPSRVDARLQGLLV